MPRSLLPIVTGALTITALFSLACLPAAANGPSVMLAVPDVRQATDYTCGASALQAVLMYWGVEVREDELAKACRTTADDGTNRHSLIRVAKEYGLQVTAAAPMSDATLRRHLDQGHPVILSLQAWSGADKPDYATRWEDGHYVVAIGYDRERLYVEDPSILGSTGWMTFKELDARWHDYDSGPDDRYTRLGIVCIGKRRAVIPETMHVD